jgi:hypothetical protein
MATTAIGGAARAVAYFALRVPAVVADLNRAQRRATVLSLACDRYLDRPGQSPQTYGEFLARTAGPLLHEPSAAARRAGQMIG